MQSSLEQCSDQKRIAVGGEVRSSEMNSSEQLTKGHSSFLFPLLCSSFIERLVELRKLNRSVRGPSSILLPISVCISVSDIRISIIFPGLVSIT